MAICVICKLAGATEIPRRGDYTEFNCAGCGAFVLTKSAVASLPTIHEEFPDAPSLLSHLLRLRNPKQLLDTQPLLGEDLADMLKCKSLPNPAEQCDNLISWLATHGKPGRPLEIMTSEVGAIIGAESNQGIQLVARHLLTRGLIEIPGGERTLTSGLPLRAALTVPGWVRYSDLQSKRTATKTAFMAMKFNDDDIEQAYKETFVPGASDSGFTLSRLNEKQPAGLIDDQLRVRIRACAFVISDLTTENAGAYWEAGFAEGLEKPVIYTCEEDAFKSGASHFDTNHHLTVTWNLKNLKDARIKLAATIRATLPHLAKLTD